MQTFPDDIPGELDAQEFSELIDSRSDSSPGPDGLCFSAWRFGGLRTRKTLFLVYVYQGLLSGIPPPPEFRACLLVFLP